jgi:hypothetical protein
MFVACPRVGWVLLRIQGSCSLVCLCSRAEMEVMESRRDGDV